MCWRITLVLTGEAGNKPCKELMAALPLPPSGSQGSRVSPLGKPPGYTLLPAPLSCFLDRATHRYATERVLSQAAIEPCINLYPLMPVHANFLSNSKFSVGFFCFSRSVFSRRQGILMPRQVGILITQCMHGGTL